MYPCLQVSMILGSSKDFLGLELGLGLCFLSSGRRSTTSPVRKRPCPYKSVDPVPLVSLCSADMNRYLPLLLLCFAALSTGRVRE